MKMRMKLAVNLIPVGSLLVSAIAAEAVVVIVNYLIFTYCILQLITACA